MPQISPDILALDGSLVWADGVPRFEATGIEDSVSLAVRLDGTPIISRTLWPYGGKVDCDLADIVAEEMRLRSLPLAELSLMLTAGGETHSVKCHAIRRDRHFPGTAAKFVAERFLTLSEELHTSPFGAVSISVVMLPDEVLHLSHKTWYRTPDGDLAETPRKEYNTGNTYRVPTLLDLSIYSAPVPEGCTPVMTEITQGERRMMLYHLSEARCIIRFNNAFGVQEAYLCDASVSTKTSLKATMTRIRRELRRYDAEETEEITVQFGPMDSEEVRRISEIAASDETYWTDRTPSGAWSPRRRVVVTSAETTSDPDPDRLETPKLTFRCATPMAVANLPAVPKTHSTEFSDEFS